MEGGKHTSQAVALFVFISLLCHWACAEPQVALHNAPKLGNFWLPLHSNSSHAADTDLCKTTMNNAIAPLMFDESCSELLGLLRNKTYHEVCSHACFNVYMDAYELLHSRACLNEDDLTPSNLRGFLCATRGVPSYKCNELADAAMNRLQENPVCESFLEELPAAHLSLNCSSACAATYLRSYEVFWNMSCLAWTEGAMSPHIFRELACASNDMPSPTPTPSNTTANHTATQPHELPVIVVPPLPAFRARALQPPSAFDAACSFLALDLLMPFRTTACGMLVNATVVGLDSERPLELCNLACFAEFIEAYTTVHSKGCFAESPLMVQSKVCAENKYPNLSLFPDISHLVGEFKLALSEPLTAGQFFQAYRDPFVASLAAATGAHQNLVSVVHISQPENDFQLVSVSFDVTVLTSEAELALASLRASTAPAPHGFHKPIVDFLNHFHLAAVAAGEISLEHNCAIQQALLPGPHIVSTEPCEDKSWHSQAPSCFLGSASSCVAETPSRACCAAVSTLILSRCSDESALKCSATEKVTMVEMFDAKCIVSSVPEDSSGHISITGDRDEHGCMTSQNYTWCPELDTCVQDWIGGHRGPCPRNTNTTTTQISCPRNCSGHGWCGGSSICKCKPGYAGSDCSTACPNLCSGRGQCQANGTCRCNTGWFGPNCRYNSSGDVPGAITNDCGGHPYMCSARGKCMNHRCVCNFGYRGATCSEMIFPECPHGCQDKGQDCVDGKCVCKPGYVGEDCSLHNVCEAFANCSGRGVCNDDGSGCQCTEGYSGTTCSVAHQCPQHCSGHGICMEDEEYTCKCDVGFVGDGCDRSPRSLCMHGCSGLGHCNQATKQCTCIRGYAGEDCSIVELPSVCRQCKHGKCIIQSTFSDSYCECNAGWEGTHCDQVTPCKTLNFCNGRGQCVNNSCECFAGFAGASCDKVDSLCGTPFCSGHGRCVTTYTMTGSKLKPTSHCECDETWKGSQCEISKCEVDANGTVCHGRGVCETVPYFGTNLTRCTCDQGYLGVGCAEVAETCAGEGGLSCSAHGTCQDGVCICHTGYEGATCSEATVISSKNNCCGADGDCSGNGQCTNCKCACDKDWDGDVCDVFTAGDPTA